MIKRLIPLFILICLLGSCAPAPASPTQTPTATVPSTRTPRPTQTSIPTATPYPPLQTKGPYLLVQMDFNNFTIFDADGSGRKQLQLSDNARVYDVALAISPDTKWLAYFTGSGLNEPYDLELHLFNLKDQTNFLIADSISSDFPENLSVLGIKHQICNISSCDTRGIQFAFAEGIEALKWSPDGQFLAFAAQID